MKKKTPCTKEKNVLTESNVLFIRVCPYFENLICKLRKGVMQKLCIVGWMVGVWVGHSWDIQNWLNCQTISF